MINDIKDIVFFAIIAGRKQKEPLLTAVSDAGGRLMDVMYGKGSVRASYRDAFGMAPEQNKVMITCLMSRDKSDALLKTLIEKFDFNKPNTGIAFTVPVKMLSF